ncbi:MAG: hypothetical protein GX604_05100 [Actinobacteria bacterium]|nr:hypothetical protein [Actinomycetota bacterium]
MKGRSLVVGLGVVLAVAAVTWAVVANGGIGLAAQSPISSSEATVAQEGDALGATSTTSIPVTTETTFAQTPDTGVAGEEETEEEMATPRTLPVAGRGPAPADIKEKARQGQFAFQIAERVWEEGGEVILDKDGNVMGINMPDRIPDGIHVPDAEYGSRKPVPLESKDQFSFNAPAFLDPSELDLFNQVWSEGTPFRVVQGEDGYRHIVIDTKKTDG